MDYKATENPTGVESNLRLLATCFKYLGSKYQPGIYHQYLQVAPTNWKEQTVPKNMLTTAVTAAAGSPNTLQHRGVGRGAISR